MEVHRVRLVEVVEVVEVRCAHLGAAVADARLVEVVEVRRARLGAAQRAPLVVEVEHRALLVAEIKGTKLDNKMNSRSSKRNGSSSSCCAVGYWEGLAA